MSVAVYWADLAVFILFCVAMVCIGAVAFWAIDDFLEQHSDDENTPL